MYSNNKLIIILIINNFINTLHSLIYAFLRGNSPFTFIIIVFVQLFLCEMDIFKIYTGFFLFLNILADFIYAILNCNHMKYSAGKSRDGYL